MFIPLVRAARRSTAILLLLSAATAARAQGVDSPTGSWELRLPSGALIATGAQRGQLGNAQLTAIQLSRAVTSRLSITGTLGWARSRDVAATDTPKLDVFTSDIGVEARSSEWLRGERTSLGAFAGIGGGARSYNYRKLDVDATNNLGAYAAVGGEIGRGRLALRIEARDYVTGFRPLVGAGKSETRNDVIIMGALRFNRRSHAEQ